MLLHAPKVNSRLANVRETRRRKLAALLEELGQTELGRLTGIDPTYLWQMGKGKGKSTRGISDANAGKIEAGLKKPPGWLDVEDELLGAESRSEQSITPPSQTARPSFTMLGSAVYVLRNYLAVRGDPPEWVDDPVLLEVAYITVEEFGEPVTSSNVIDLATRLAQRLRAQGERGEREAVEGAGRAAG